MIRIDDVTFYYSAGILLGATESGIEHASLTCAPGTVTLLAGPSGSGKSTLIKLMNGLAPHFHEGELTGLIDVAGYSPSERPLYESIEHSATVFQNPRTQFFTDQVSTELAFGLENLGAPPEQISKRMAKVAAETAIGPWVHRMLRTLSGGQLQRVAYATALMPDTDVVLFDEPTSNLSEDGISMLRDNVAQLKAAGRTIVIAEHRLHVFRELADQVIYVRDGKIVATYTAADFFQLDDETRRHLGLRQLTAPTPVKLPPPTAPGLVIENLRYSVNGTRILNIEHMLFPAGKVTALVGPNGVGKTTLARVLCGLAQPERGATISLQGTALSARQRIASSYIVMQDVGRQLFAESVESEVTLGVREKVDTAAILAAFDLDTLQDRHPHSLSGGQRQRLVMASAMAQRKQVYIFDEPTSGVGIEHLEAIAQQFKQLANSGAVVIVITHDQELVAACADHRQELLPQEANSDD